MDSIVRAGTLVGVLVSVLLTLVGASPTRRRHARPQAAPIPAPRRSDTHPARPSVPALRSPAAPATPTRVRPYVPPVPFMPIPPAPLLPPRAAMVRPYVLAAEHRRERDRADRSRLGVAVLLDIARAGERTR